MKRHTTLGLPSGDARVTWFAAAALLLALVLSMCRGLGGFDSPELALVARQLGLGHPPGQPLHSMLGFVLSHLPGVPPLFGLNLLSALSCALSLVPAMAISEQLLQGRVEVTGRVRGMLAASLVLLGLHGGLWEAATRIEVYALAGFFGLWATARLASTLDGPRPAFFSAGVGMGLCASANPMIASLLALAMAPALIARLLRRRLSARGLAHAIAGGLCGLTPYAYVFAVAGRRDVLVWGSPVDGPRLHHYFSFADFADNNVLTASMLASHLWQWLLWAASVGILPLLVFGAALMARLARGRGLGAAFVPLATLLSVLFVCSNVVWKLDNPDLLAYLVVPLWLGSAGLAAGVGFASAQRSRLGWAALLVLGLATLTAPPELHSRTRHLDDFSQVQARMVLAELPKGALLVSQSDHLAGAILYLQHTEKLRPDVAHLVYGLSSSSWYWELLFRRHPDLLPTSLRGPGGRPGRLARLLAANPQRPVLFERSALAFQLSKRVCPWGFSLARGALCDRSPGPGLAAEHLLSESLARIGAGSPTTDQLIAMVALQRGLGLWRLGMTGAAVQALRSGVPRAQLPSLSADALTALPPVPALRGADPGFQRSAVLGDPARNLWLAAGLLRQAGARDAAGAHLVAAWSLGLPEARVAATP